MYELNGKEYSLERLQKAASDADMDFDSYFEAMKAKGLVEKIKDVAEPGAAVASGTPAPVSGESPLVDTSPESQDPSLLDKVGKKFRQYMPSFLITDPLQKGLKVVEEAERKEIEKQRVSSVEYIKDKQDFTNFLQQDFLADDKYNYAAMSLRNESKEVRKKLFDELGVAGFFGTDTRTQFMNLNDDDIRNIFNEQFDTKVLQQKSKIEAEKIEEATQSIIDSGGSLDKEFATREDIDIMSFKNPLERQLAKINQRLRVEDISDEEKNNLIEQQKDVVEKLKAPRKIIGRQGQVIELASDHENFNFFYNPITGEGSTTETEDSQDLSKQVEVNISELSTTTQDKLEQYYNNNILEGLGHKRRGKETYNITVGSKAFSTILSDAGYKAEKGVYQNVPVSQMARFAHLFDDDPTIFMAKNNINISSDDPNKSDFKDAQDFADYLRVYQEDGRDIAAKKQAIKQVYLLNKDVTSIKKKPIQRHFEAASEGILGPRATESNFGYSNRKILDQIEEITADADIPLNDKQKEYLERSIGDEINEGFGGAYGILGSLLVANKVQGTVLGVTRLGKLMSTLNAPRYVKKGRVVSQSTLIKKAAETGKSFDDVAAGFTKIGPSRLNQFNGLLLTGAMEEAKMQPLGFDPGVGAGFMLGAKALPFKWTTKYNQLNTLLNLSTKQAPAFVLGTNFGELTKGAIDDIAGEEVYSAFLNEHYGDLDKVGRKAIVDLALGAAFGATHLKGMDVKRTSSIAKLKNDAMVKMVDAHTKGDDVTLAKYQEIYSAAKNRLDAMDKIDLYTNPATAQKAYQKQLDPVVKAFKAKGKDLVIETTTEELADGRNAEYIPMQGGNPGKIRININKANPGLIPHEVSHAAFDLLFEGNATLKGKYLNQLKNITKEIKLEDGRSLYEAILQEKSIKDINKVEEMFSYTTEYLSRAEHYTSLVAGNAFGKLKQNILSFSERNGLGKPALKTQQDLVNFLGRYVETIQKGYNPIKQLERLNEIVEVSEARKEGEKASFGSIDLKAKKAKIIEQNKKLIAEKSSMKPEEYAKQVKKNSEALKKINENLRISEANEKNIKIFKEREPGDPVRTRAENELVRDNVGIIEAFIKNEFKPGLDVSEAEFRAETNFQVAKIMKSYNDFNVPFGYYLRDRLGGKHTNAGFSQQGNILRRAQAGRTTEVAMSEMGKDFDIETLADVTPTASAEGVGTHSAKGRRLVEDLKVPETTVNSIIEKVKELDVEKLTYKTLKDLAPEFTNELLGVEPKVGNISKGSVENAQKWFSNDTNAKLFLDILPEGAVSMEGAPELVKGTATGVQKKLLEGFYKKSDRAKTKAGLPVQEKIKSKDVQDVKEFFGIKPDGTFEYNRNLSAKVKGAVEQIGKAITNQVVREAAKNDVILGENIGKENLLNQIQAGKSEALASIDLLYKENKIKVSNIKIQQDIGRFIRDEAEFKKSNPKEHGIIKDFVELQTKYEAEIGRENEVKFTKEAKKLPFKWAKNGSWQVSTAKFKKDAKLVEEFKDNAFDLADIIPLSENMTLGNAKMLVDLFTGHYSVIRGIKQYDKVDSPFKLGIRERLVNGKESPLSQELQQRWKEFSWDKLKSSYASQFYTGLKKVYEQNTLEAQKAEVRKFANSENGKLQVELYDLWNSTLQEWVSISKKGSKEYNNKMNFIARMKKHNSSIGTTGERVLAPDGYYYLPGKVVQGTLKYEHLKSSSEQSFESLALIANGAWMTRGKESLKKYQGIWGMLKDFNTIDRQTGETNSAGIHRLAESLELAKNIWSVKSDFKRNLYQDIVSEVGQKEVNRIIKSDKAITKQSVNKLKNIGLGYSGMSGAMASKNLKIHDKAVELGKKRNKKSRGMSTFDFDDTLATTKSGVRYEMPNPSGKPAPQRKAILLVGAAGAGKTTVINQLGLRKQGFKYVNQDVALDWLSKNSGLPKDMNDFTREQSNKWRDLQYEAAYAARDKASKLRGKGDGVIIDSTGGNIREISRDFKDAGYDVQVIHVNSSLETALARNRSRTERKLTDTTVKNSYEKVQKSIKGIKELVDFFPKSVKEFVEVNTDNIKQGDALPADFVKKINNFTSGYIKGRINAEQFALEGSKLLEQGAKYDFSEFNKVVEGAPGPLLKTALERAKKFGTDNMFVLTARPAASAGPIREFLKSQGLDIPLENITGLGNSTGEAKALWMLKKFSEGYNDMYFVDDALPNVKAVRDVLNQLDIKSDVQQALASIDLSRGVNDIMQHSLDIKSEKRFSKAEAKVRGKDIKRRRFFFSDSAADLELLIEPLYGKGRKGIENKEWFKKEFVQPFERGIRDYNTAKQSTKSDYMALRKQNKDVVKQLPGQVEGTNFTNDMAIRVYLWSKAGHTIPDLAPTTQKKLVKHITDNPKLQAYAEQFAKLTKVEGGLKEPTGEWWAETLAGEIINMERGVPRKKYLQDWIDRKNEIFSEENLNKMESKLGTRWRENIEDMFDRMETGRTRGLKLDRGSAAMMNYLNGSVGTIMNFNTRSAALQTISTINFLNMRENNPIAAARAMGDVKQFSKDFMRIMNSDMLKQRRDGLQINVTEAELASAAAESKNPIRSMTAKILKAGYLPTKLADSFAISFGGATFYRNRIKMYEKQGLSTKEAEAKAWIDFQALSERTQQSSRPDLLSKQQTSFAGRLILPFANTPMQMNRRGAKDIFDLAKGRYKNKAEAAEKMGRITYYMGAQVALFAGLQSALFGMLLNDEDVSNEKIEKTKTFTLNTISDSFLRGLGIQGAVLSGLKNAVAAFHKEEGKGFTADYSEVGEALLNISPPIGSKFGKLDAAGNNRKWAKIKDEDEFKFELGNPSLEASLLTIEALSNLPVHGVHVNTNNIIHSLNSDYENWQRVHMIMGWTPWNVGVESDSEKKKKKDKKKQEFGKPKPVW